MPIGRRADPWIKYQSVPRLPPSQRTSIQASDVSPSTYRPFALDQSPPPPILCGQRSDEISDPLPLFSQEEARHRRKLPGLSLPGEACDSGRSNPLESGDAQRSIFHSGHRPPATRGRRPVTELLPPRPQAPPE